MLAVTINAEVRQQFQADVDAAFSTYIIMYRGAWSSAATPQAPIAGAERPMFAANFSGRK